MIENDNEMFALLKELSNKAEWDSLPKNLLNAIGFTTFNSGVSVSIVYNETFLFSFELTVPYERSEFTTFSFDEVVSLLKDS